jgi:hypothetical protein
MASDGFRLWYQARHSVDATPAPLPAATEALTEWAARTEIAPEKPQQRTKNGGVDMRTKKGRALKAGAAPNG